jgi:hypothetical protein
MAETKTRSKRAKPKTKKTTASKAKAKTKTRAASKPKATSKAKAAPASKPKATSKAKASSNSKPKGLVDKSKAAAGSVEETVKDAGGTIGRVAGKAKVPLMAGGAALAGAAGGIALGASQAHRKSGLSKISGKDLAKAARKAGDVGAQVGEIALEVRRARETSGNGNGRHRSPIEVVLQGLTSRGPRG